MNTRLILRERGYWWLSCCVSLHLCVGCKYQEPAPSADIYLGATAPMLNAEPQQPTRISSTVRRQLRWIQNAAPEASSYEWSTPTSGLLVRDNGDVLRFLPDGTKRVLLNGQCQIALPSLFVNCTAEQARHAVADALIGRVLAGKGTASLRFVEDGSGVRVEGGGVTGLVLTATARGIKDIRLNDVPLLAELVAASQPKSLDLQRWHALIANPTVGSSGRTHRRSFRVACVSHSGGLADIGPAVRRARDRAVAAKVDIQEHAGVFLRSRKGARQVCVVVTGTGAGIESFEGRPVWRTWSIGAYGQLLEREAIAREKARRAGARTSGDWVITLYHDPSSTPESQCWSYIDVFLSG